MHELPPGSLVAIYIRVSRGDQDTALQRAAIEQFVAHYRWLVFRVYIDHGHSGSKDKRPDLNRLMQDAHALKFKAVLVWKLDRFGRNTRHLLNTLHTLENELNIRFITVTQAIDTTTAMGKMFRGMLALFAEFEQALISERTTAGMRKTQANGVRLGRTPTLTLEQTLKALELRATGLSFRRIAKQLGTAHVPVYRALKRPPPAPSTPSTTPDPETAPRSKTEQEIDEPTR